jgi:flavodoxin
MKKVLISYFTRTGHTQQMAEYIAEGVRISENEAELKKINDIKNEKGLMGYDGYVFGSPTYHRTMPGAMETFLFLSPLSEHIATCMVYGRHDRYSLSWINEVRKH